MADWDFGPGAVPNVQPGDIRNALKVLQPIRQSGRKESSEIPTSVRAVTQAPMFPPS